MEEPLCELADVIAIVADGIPHCEMADIVAIVAYGMCVCFHTPDEAMFDGLANTCNH